MYHDVCVNVHHKKAKTLFGKKVNNFKPQSNNKEHIIASIKCNCDNYGAYLSTMNINDIITKLLRDNNII